MKSILVVLALVFVVAASGCVQTGKVIDTGPSGAQPQDTQSPALQCPSSCSDGNPCTTDFCSESTGFKCSNNPLSGADCGDGGVCKDGECVVPVDDCTDIFRLYGETEGGRCYQDNYVKPAVKDKNTSICDGMTDAEFVGMCYSEVALKLDDYNVCTSLASDSVRDDCYMNYASTKAHKLYIFTGGACDLIMSTSLKEECTALKDFVTAPAGIKEFFAKALTDGSGNIASYIILRDMNGGTTTSDGTVTVYIMQQDSKGEEKTRLYYSTFDVKKEDFEYTNIGGFGGASDTAYVLPTINVNDFSMYPTESSGRIYVTFKTSDGRSFSVSQDLEF